MQRRVHVLIPWSCPRCDAEFVVTLDQIDAHQTVYCTKCRVAIALKPDGAPLAPERPREDASMFHQFP